MIIYLDESKRIGKGKIIIGGFLSFHNTHYIETFMKNKKKQFNIPEKVELKSTNKFGKLFSEKISNDSDFEKLDITTFSFHFDNYFFDSEDTYLNNLLKIFNIIFNKFILKKTQKVAIIHDNLNFKNNLKVSQKINFFLKKDNIKSDFKIHNSKKYLSLQLSDLIVGEYKKLYFFDDVTFLEDYIYKKDINKKT
ncbi:MAG: DUF3800 domain-containing protein [Candidatus Gracilibacteria bacterium]|nr:DUF3800 domain-containing protein [Candidatus Gracilibacteria bacterium]